MLGKLMYGILYVWFHTMRAISWFRWTVEGRHLLPPRESGGAVVVMNHVSWADIPIIATLLPFNYRLSWLAKSELFANPIIAWWYREMMVIPIRRGRRDLAALETAVEALRGGAVLLVFPEGTRSRNGVLSSGRGGAVRMAMLADVPIIPVGIVGTEHGPKGSFQRKPVHLRIGPAYKVTPPAQGKVTAEQMEHLTHEMMSRIADLLPEERRGAYGAGSKNRIPSGEPSATQPVAAGVSTRHQV
ncbi:MAG: lysophospholipid acyltransferase family protein [Oscillochloridaceae bacterium umkhey_bin13]